MEKYYRRLQYVLTGMIMLLFADVYARQGTPQVNVSIQVLPPYPTKITDYASRPQLMLITIVNTSRQQQRIQLRGEVSGDNGIAIRTKPSYKSRQPIILNPGETRSLNGGDVAYFFDYTQLNYENITQNEFINKNGLPEGVYRFCLRAFNYDTNEPLSADEPIGCSNPFTISSLEPPTIIRPMAGEILSDAAGQVFAINWSTPPGTPPSIRYRIRMVEMLGNKNPNDALATATEPYFFDKEVTGNMYVYNPSDPQLTKGRMYALMVEAFDPFNTAVFRNRGRSEVTAFAYGTTEVVNTALEEDKGKNEVKEPPVEYATNTIKGRLLWAFKKTEPQYRGTSSDLSGSSLMLSSVVRIQSTVSVQSLSGQSTASPGSASGAIAGSAANQVFNAANALNDSRYASAALIDPTLTAIFAPPVSAAARPPAGEVIYTSGGSNIAYTEDVITVDSASEKYSLAGVKVVIRGVLAENWSENNDFSKQAQQQQLYNNRNLPAWLGLRPVAAASSPSGTKVRLTSTVTGINTPGVVSNTARQGTVLQNASTLANTAGILANNNKSAPPSPQNENTELLGSASTDGAGNFSISLLHPSYTGVSKYKKIVLSVQSSDFEQMEMEVPLDKAAPDGVIDFGTILLLAKTYRFTPKFTVEKVDEGTSEKKTAVIHIYRDKADFDKRPYLYQEGNIPYDAKHGTVINGRNVVEIAVDSVNVNTSGGTIRLGRLFYEGRFLVRIESHNQRFGGRTTDLQVKDIKLSSNRVLNVKADYALSAVAPSISGEVRLSLPSGFVPVSGAVVKVEYNKEDVIAPAGYMTSLGAISQHAVSSVMNITGVTAYSASVGSDSHQVTAPSGFIALPLNTGLPVNGNAATGQLTTVAQSVLARTDALSLINMLSENYGPYSAKTDSSGRFRIGSLPQLKEGAQFRVKLVKVGGEFRDLEVTPDTVQEIASLKRGSSKEIIFSIKPDLVNIVGRVVSADKKAIANARLHFQGSVYYFNTGEDGIFEAGYYKGKHKLVIEKEGYMPRTIDVNIPAPGDSGGSGTLFQGINAGMTHAQLQQNFSAAALLSTPTVQASVARGFSFGSTMFGSASSASQPSGQLSSSVVASVISETNKTRDTGSRGTVSPGVTVINNAPLLTNSSIIGNTGFLAVSMPMSELISANYRNNPLLQPAVRTIDLGDCGHLAKRTGKIRFRVTGPDNAPLSNVTIALFDTSHVTDVNGEWYYEGFGGNANVRVTPPESLSFVPVEKTVNVLEDGTEKVQTFTLQAGTIVTGTVRSSQGAISGANIIAVELPYITASTAANGAYRILLPKASSLTLKASKSGYISAGEAAVTNASALTIDFTLADGGGKNIDKLLGFPVELDKMVPEGNAYRISGSFTDLRPVYSAFTSREKISLKFTNVRVTFDAQNNPVPESNRVQTDELRVPLKLFNFLPVVLKNDAGIVVSAASGGKGEIRGSLEIDMESLQGNRGYLLAKGAVPRLLPEDVSTSDIALFSSGSGPAELSRLKFRGSNPGSSDWEAEVYGFKLVLNFADSYVDVQGLHLAGQVKTPDLGIIKPASLSIDQFVIDSRLQISKLQINTTGLPALSIGNWSASLATLLFNEDGFKFGGSITLQIPKSAPSNVTFSDLRMGKDIFYGGSFYIPQEGINLLNVVKLTAGREPLSFGKVPGSTAYKLAGSGKIRFSQYITKEINLPVFEVQTDGRFMIDAPANFTADFAFAKFKVQTIQFNTTGQTPFIGVRGEFTVDVPLLKFSAGDITFKAKTSGGVEASVSRIGVSIDIPVMKSDIQVGIKENGFEGSGSLSVPGTPINAAVSFHYLKVAGGVDLGASFSAGVVIPIGLISIERVGGGFNYNSAEKKFKIDINGAVAITGTGALVKLDPIGVTVESGPVITGYGAVKVASYLELARASLVIDVPNQYFSITVDSDIEPLKGLARAKLQGDLVISGKSSDRYIFFGCGMAVDLFGLIHANADYALGVGLSNPRTRTDRISYYFREADPSYINTEFSGVYLNTSAKMGIPEDKAIGFDIFVASASLWFYTESKATLLMNFAEDSYLLGLSGKYGGGLKACAVGLCVSAGFEACYNLRGGRNNSQGWFIAGSAGGKADFKIGGCDPGCNSVDGCFGWPPAGARVCATASVDASYSQNKGLHLGARVGGSRSVCP